MFDANGIIGNCIQCPVCQGMVKIAADAKQWRCTCGNIGDVPNLYEFGRIKQLATSFRKSDPQKAISILVTLNEMKIRCGFANYAIIDDELQIMLLLQQIGNLDEACKKLSELLKAQIPDDKHCSFGPYFHRTLYFLAVYDKARLFCERVTEYRLAVAYSACAILCDLLNRRQTKMSYSAVSEDCSVSLKWEDVRSSYRSGLTRNLNRLRMEAKLPIIWNLIFAGLENNESPDYAATLFQTIFDLLG